MSRRRLAASFVTVAATALTGGLGCATSNPPPPEYSVNPPPPEIEPRPGGTGGTGGTVITETTPPDVEAPKDETVPGGPPPTTYRNPPPPDLERPIRRNPPPPLPEAQPGEKVEQRTDGTCWVYVTVDCPPAGSGISCNPPPPKRVACPQDS